MKNNFKKGFTLIELLVVISIIALLSTIVLGALQDARAKARDRALASSVMQLQNAIEIYKTNHGTYPGQLISGTAFMNVNSSGVVTDPNNILSQIQLYIPKFPQPTIGIVQYFVDFSATRKCGADGTNQPYFISFNIETTTLDNWPSQYNNNSGVWTEIPDRKCVSIQ